MSSNGSTMDYDVPEKAAWRKWWVREVRTRLDRMEVRRKDAIILYLAGRADAERKLWLGAGIRDENLIAVERDADNVKHLRKQGVNVIHGDICKVLQSWQSPVRPHVISADLCCGLTMAVNELIHAAFWFWPTGRGGVLALNLMRGRDKTELLECYQHRMQKIWSQVQLSKNEKRNIRGNLRGFTEYKNSHLLHRGYMAQIVMVCAAFSPYVADYQEETGKKEPPIEWWRSGQEWFEKLFPAETWSSTFSYSSSVNRALKMDSIVATLPSQQKAYGGLVLDPEPIRNIQARIAAALAVRTARLRSA